MQGVPGLLFWHIGLVSQSVSQANERLKFFWVHVFTCLVEVLACQNVSESVANTPYYNVS